MNPVRPTHLLTRMADLDWINPILIKNLRQAFRGNFLRRSFLLALVVATGAGLVALTMISSDASAGEDSGRLFFMAVYLALCGAVVGLLPLSAMITGDADAARQERLYLTPLPAAVIVRGRLLAALGQGGGVALGLLPYMAMSLLLPGIDPLGILVCVVMTLTLGLTLSAFGVAMTSFFSNRLFIAVATALVAAIQAGSMMMAVASAEELISHPNWLQDEKRWLGFLAIWSMMMLASGFSLFLAQLGASRPEENGARNGRVFAVLTVPLIAVLFWREMYASAYPSLRGAAQEVPMMLGVLFGIGIAPFALDSRTLSPQMAAQLPASRLRRLLALPLLPGAGRGLLLFCAVLSVWSLLWWWQLTDFVALPKMAARYSYDDVFDWQSRFVDSCKRNIIFLMLPAPLIARLPGKLSSLLALPALGMFWALMAAGVELLQMVMEMFRYMRAEEMLTTGEGLHAIFLLAIALNVPRLVRGVLEVWEAPPPLSRGADV